ncbi:hypothetical protein HMPREF1991_00128 [Hoylesella loescheii DSM 19665 = JCM 12249 = ATCC 15930]|uniref:Uncharacterized protein n=1 Tax=Hoylesella loescheii DSM 19665 = JCM 12249 = ATCC 15930 TaxID=1122985 RepID=A0A069QV82_HOYLO|nr:hypothetical protein HMPREF1991_00128 [Hoylesella loescheii DSM 19665 = JCM 12249 = ATCC 15930]
MANTGIFFLNCKCTIKKRNAQELKECYKTHATKSPFRCNSTLSLHLLNHIGLIERHLKAGT